MLTIYCTSITGRGCSFESLFYVRQDFAHPAADRTLQYDNRQARGVLAECAPSITDPAARARLEAASSRAWARIDAVSHGFRAQVSVLGPPADPPYQKKCV